MPFTFSHPAIVLPLTSSKRFSATALIAGSMVPDFEFFFQMREVENIGHHWYGVLLFDVPAALFICYLFHLLLRNLFIQHLPSFLRSRFSEVLNFNWNKFAAANKWVVFYSLLTGIASHLFWDGFTHHDGLFVELLPLLAVPISFGSVSVPVYFLLQVLCSVLGMIAVMFFIVRLPQQSFNDTYSNPRLYWLSLTLVFLIILLIRITVWPAYNSFWSVFMAVMGSGCYSWILVSVFFKKFFIKKMAL